jgi:hypothetical protein
MDWFSWKTWFKRKKDTQESTELRSLGADPKIVEQLQQENEKLRRTVDSLLTKFGANVEVNKKSLDGLPQEDLEKLKKLSVTQTKEENSGLFTKLPSATKTDDVTISLIGEGELGQLAKSSLQKKGDSVPRIKETCTNVASSSSSSNSSSSSSPSSASLSSDSEESKDSTESSQPSIDARYKNAIFVKSSQKDEVAVVDTKSIEWWTIVNPETLGEDEDKDITLEDSELGEPFAVVQQDDVNESIANFLAVSIERHPDAKQLSPAELKQLLDGTFAQIKKQGKMSQAYGWGMWLYSSYSWGSYVVRIYREPTLVKLVLRAACVLYNQPVLIPVFARGLWSAASWALIAYL